MKEQQALMKFDPATGLPQPYPSHAAQYREWHGLVAWLFNPWTGERRDPRDIGSDVQGFLIWPELRKKPLAAAFDLVPKDGLSTFFGLVKAANGYWVLSEK